MKRYRLSWIAFHVLVGLESLVQDKVGDMVVSVISAVRRRLINGVR